MQQLRAGHRIGVGTLVRSRQLLTSACVAFLASFCTLVIELVAGRILAPYVGVSLYTWTSIIGVVLAALSLGALVGGKLADRFPRNESLAWLLMASGLTAVAIVPLVRWLGPLPISESLMLHISVLTGLVFFAPCFLLGAITPVAIRLAVEDLERSGTVVGQISSLSTLGAILGTFATGFFLISRFGTRSILLSIAALLMVSGLALALLTRQSTRHPQLVGLAIVPISLIVLSGATLPSRWFQIGDKDAYFVEESNYFTIQLEENTRADGMGRLEVLSLDHLVHSYTDLEDPSFLAYDYLNGLADVVEAQVTATNHEPLRYLFLGGGGYTFPRYLEHLHSEARIDVVEIDPAVSKVAFEHLGVDHDTRIRTINQDARWFVRNFEGQPYDLVFVDVFNDLAVPYHVTTLEFFEQLEELLSPTGLLVVHVLDRFHSGRFLPALALTIRHTFGAEETALWAHFQSRQLDRRSSFLVFAGRSNQPIDQLLLDLQACRPCKERGSIFSQLQLGEYLEALNPVLLTDDFAPVDALVLALYHSDK